MNRQIKCINCEDLHDYRGRVCRKCMSDYHRPELKFHSSGRVLIYHNSKWQYRSRIVASDRLGRPLKPDEMIHHINGNFQDDRPENMLISTNSYHRDLHNWMGHLYMQEHFWRI